MRTCLTGVVAVLIAACAPAAVPNVPVVPAPAAPGIEEAVATITAADVQRHIAFLASDSLQGRDTPSPGLESAAAYIAEQFRSYGLQPAGDSGTFIQRFPYGRSSIDVARLRVQARAHGMTVTPDYARDYFVIPSAVDSVVGTPVFAGRARTGMAPPEDAAGKIVFVFVPEAMGPQWQQSVSAALQASFAARAGAVVIVLDSSFTQQTIGALAEEVSGQQLPLPIIGMSYETGRGIMEHGGLDLRTLGASTEAQTTALNGVTFVISTPTVAASNRVPNVVAILPGSDAALRDEYIVFSAHMDHVGVGAPDATGDSIYNGADDDASGTTAVLEIAQAYAALDRKPARSILFLLVSGEEKGLLGSAYFVEHPPVPTARMAADINIDMIGRNARDTVVAIGHEYSSLGAAVQRIAAAHRELGLVVAADLWPEEQLFFRSDHFNFAVKEVPAIFFTTGLHADYHKPSDEPETIDNDKLMRVARLLARFGYDIANTPARPQWTAQGLEAVRQAARR